MDTGVGKLRGKADGTGGKHAVRGIPQDIFDWHLTCPPGFYGWAGYYDVLLVPEEVKEKKGVPNE